MSFTFNDGTGDIALIQAGQPVIDVIANAPHLKLHENTLSNRNAIGNAYTEDQVNMRIVATDVPGNTVKCLGGYYFAGVGNVRYEVAEGAVSAPFGPVSGANLYRFDIVYVDSDEVLKILVGDESGTDNYKTQVKEIPQNTVALAVARITEESGVTILDDTDIIDYRLWLSSTGSGHIVRGKVDAESGLSDFAQENVLSFEGNGVTVAAETGKTVVSITGGDALAGHAVEDEGNAVATRDILNFIGAGVNAAVNGTRIEVTVPGTLIADTSPQLGGDLDLNGKGIDFPTTPNITDCLDEDDFASNSAVKLATQRSVKKYVDDKVTASGSGTVTTSGTPEAADVAVFSGGTIIEGKTYTEFRSAINVEDGADVTNAASVNTAGAVMEIDFSANTILAANSNDIPVALTVAESTIVGRKAGGNIAALSPAEARVILDVSSGGDVTDYDSVEAAGAVMETDTTTVDMQFVIDEDGFGSDLATKVPTQQSVKAYIADQLAILTPPGTIIMYGGAALPDGYLKCIGEEFATVSYPLLSAAIGINWGTASAGNFRLPDLRNKYIKGSSTGITAGGTITSRTKMPASFDIIQDTHRHTIDDDTHDHGNIANSGTSGDHAHSTDTTEPHQHTTVAGGIDGVCSGTYGKTTTTYCAGAFANAQQLARDYTQNAPGHAHTISGAGTHGHTITDDTHTHTMDTDAHTHTTSGWDSENEVPARTVYFCIKT